ncbi:F1F0 ATP synthase subunit g KNAG_0G01170 [Huiozyma naganishii CBS 8797]|uniref:ATP synthase subunit g, mitochondrial n=1 Tax=Huiozyma naganishii (strain ATCC MYA-139 / BCRC 22969 / CBS 8797 / KCTC 17520 / NBRC 10181 / NCYC 3082 / Yp74L-3) TaxID=1071383 RepID=J7R8H8_HUIN7|nr:hypothetical protein KNAG_0G01170 [Kazachstania naganishii CBS 8797]CCK71175.1 hypothetical protein KNAG_0G01170 [Kazachstania naganishii CBS 8797]
MLGRLQSNGGALVGRVVNMTTKAVNVSLYYGKVGAELSKQVYLKEKLQPPSWADFQSVYLKLYQSSLRLANSPKAAIDCLSQIPKNDLIKYGSIGVQLVGFYSVGEVIGRRKLVGYRTYNEPAGKAEH